MKMLCVIVFIINKKILSHIVFHIVVIRVIFVVVMAHRFSEKGGRGGGKRLLPESAVDVGDLEERPDGRVKLVKALSGRCVVRNVHAPEEGGRGGGRGGEESVDGIEMKREEEEEEEGW